MVSLLDIGGFQLHKWSANHLHILEGISNENKLADIFKIDKHNCTIKTLGLNFETDSDFFEIITPKLNFMEYVTKRHVLSFISFFYDPLGFAGPVILTAKLFIKMLWVHNLNWDDVLPNDLLKEWRNFAKQLFEMPVINIPRSFNFYIALTIELVGYYDTSSVAYCKWRSNLL